MALCWSVNPFFGGRSGSKQRPGARRGLAWGHGTDGAMRSRRGETLMELLMALLILGLVLAAVLQTLSSGLKTVDQLWHRDARQYGAQWWFTRLPRPVSTSSLAAMPASGPGGLNFIWEARTGTFGELQITLTVRDGDGSLRLTRTF